jgi:hypothetical protein
MSQAELNRAVAAATGESVGMIASHGFSLIDPMASLEAEPSRQPLMVDWDELESERRAA